MSTPASPSVMSALSPRDTAESRDRRAELAEIDESTSGTVLLFFLAGMAWLLIGTLFALIASYKLHSPEFLNQYAWLTFGRIRTAHLNAVIFGFSAEVAVGVVLWLMCRLCRVPLMAQSVINAAAIFWNVGLVIGIGGILRGDTTGIEYLELPKYATPILFVAFALIAVWTIVVFRFRRERHLYVSQWYILAAVLWFPWLYSTAQLLLVLEPARGTVQAAVNWWFGHNVLGLWFTPIGLAAIYYFLPKVIGRPIHSYYLSVLGFWTLALFYNWNGFHHLVGGPFPAWMITISIVASVMMVIPVVSTAINHHFTMVGHFGKLKYSPTLRFIVFGAVSYTISSLQGVLSSVRWFSEVAHFTHHTVAHAHWGMYAFFTMTMFGSMYYILPRITQREWPSERLISLHFWCTALGIILYVVPLSYGGWLQGKAMLNATTPFLEVVQGTLPWLKIRTVSGLLLALGHVAFFANLIWLLARRFGPYRQPEPMILAGVTPAAPVGK
ncbi:MAG: cbb3-type cytochrome c oxidase subunit I [Verrucomicrobiales bacterium]|nr:cbb3-type cytochrome c oxidase subunit I [Verrucomicrobiales bacterium]